MLVSSCSVLSRVALADPQGQALPRPVLQGKEGLCPLICVSWAWGAVGGGMQFTTWRRVMWRATQENFTRVTNQPKSSYQIPEEQTEATIPPSGESPVADVTEELPGR